jgi:hypothetical protein
VVGQVKVVGILMMVNGLIITITGGVIAAVGPMMMAVAPPAAGGGAGGGLPPELFLVIYGILGGVILLCGVVNVFAGYRVMGLRNRILGIVALFLNSIPFLITCYCGLTIIPMMIYGLIVLFQPDVGRAFEYVAGGATPDEAVRKFTRRFDDVRDDYDEMSDARQAWEESRRRRRAEEDDLRLDLDDDERR